MCIWALSLKIFLVEFDYLLEDNKEIVLRCAEPAMKYSKTFTAFMTLLLIVSSSPYLTSALISSHGHHDVSTVIEGSSVKVVFHHDGEDHHHDTDSQASTDDHPDQLPVENHSDHDTDHLLSLSVEVAKLPSSLDLVASKSLPAVLTQTIFLVLSITNFSDASIDPNHRMTIDRPIASSLSLQATVLLI